VAVSEEARREVGTLAGENLICYQCGQCTAACPSGRELERGPRRLMRLILTEQAEELLDSDDLWRCTGCGACSAACPMKLDVAGAIERLRAVGRTHGARRCPEREAAIVAARRLAGHDTIDSVAFGAAMAARGFLPKDVAGAAGAGARLVRDRLGRRAAPAADSPQAVCDSTGGARAATPPRVFFTGCALLQDATACAQTRDVANGLGLPLAEAAGAGCCGHPSRGASGAGFSSDETVVTVCPACDRSLEESGTHTTPLWEALVDHALRGGRALRAAGPAFVPYVGCLADRDMALDALARAAGLAGVDCLTSYPSLHAGCCGALGGIYRGETHAARRLLDYAVERSAPIVTTCLLCRDNLRSAARRRRLSVPIHFWPEFFSAGPADAIDGSLP